MTSPYPLAWPEGVQRTKLRSNSPFRTGYPKAVENIVASLRGFERDGGGRIEAPILSSNLDLMGRLSPADPGVAAWFRFEGQHVCFAVDRFNEVAANAQAIHHIIEARRVELRYGGLNIVRQTFRSFVALPAPTAARPWWDVLQCKPDASAEIITAQYRRLANDRHPDKGGSHDAMAELSRARDQALKERA